MNSDDSKPSTSSRTRTKDGQAGHLSSLLLLISGELYVVSRIAGGRTGWSLRKFPDDGLPARDVWVDDYGEMHCDCKSGTMNPRVVCKHIKAICEQEMLP